MPVLVLWYFPYCQLQLFGMQMHLGGAAPGVLILVRRFSWNLCVQLALALFFWQVLALLPYQQLQLREPLQLFAASIGYGVALPTALHVAVVCSQAPPPGLRQHMLRHAES